VILYQIYVGGDPWLYWRVISPYVPILFLSVAYAGSAVARTTKRIAMALRRTLDPLKIEGLLVGAVILAVPFAVSLANKAFYPELTFKRPPLMVHIHQRNTRTGLTLARICDPEATVGVIWAGTIPYYSGTRATDFLGKTDKHIARRRADLMIPFSRMTTVPGHNKYDLG